MAYLLAHAFGRSYPKYSSHSCPQVYPGLCNSHDWPSCTTGTNLGEHAPEADKQTWPSSSGGCRFDWPFSLCIACGIVARSHCRTRRPCQRSAVHELVEGNLIHSPHHPSVPPRFLTPFLPPRSLRSDCQLSLYCCPTPPPPPRAICNFAAFVSLRSLHTTPSGMAVSVTHPQPGRHPPASGG